MSSFGESISQQYTYFLGLDRWTKSLIVISTFSGAASAYKYSSDLPLAITGLITAVATVIFTKKAFSAEDERLKNDKKHQKYKRAIAARETSNKDLKEQCVKWLKLTEQKAAKQYALGQSADSGFEKTILEIRANNKKCSAEKIMQLINAARVLHTNKKFSSIDRANARKKEEERAEKYAKKLVEINELDNELESIQGQVSVIKDSMLSKKFSEKFNLLVAISEIGGVAFVGVCSGSYIITTAQHTPFTETQVIVPTLLIASTAFGIGGVKGYKNHQVKLMQEKELDELEKISENLESQEVEINKVYRKITKLLFDVDEEENTAHDEQKNNNALLELPPVSENNPQGKPRSSTWAGIKGVFTAGTNFKNKNTASPDEQEKAKEKEADIQESNSLTSIHVEEVGSQTSLPGTPINSSVTTLPPIRKSTLISSLKTISSNASESNTTNKSSIVSTSPDARSSSSISKKPEGNVSQASSTGNVKQASSTKQVKRSRPNGGRN
jgi:hypothetical protein